MIFLWMFFEIVGTIAFAISGALVGVSRKMDIFGMLVLALSTAIGGGIIFDLSQTDFTICIEKKTS